jgi:hypothetical protein
MDASTVGWMHGLMFGCTDGRVDGWMDIGNDVRLWGAMLVCG